jgi:hypothetical protein
MTSRITKPDYEKAAELANAMRTGLDDLRSMPVAHGTNSPSSGLTDLATYADLRSLPPLAKKGRITSGIARAARSFLRALMRPWLAVQTEFNQGVMAEFDDLRRRVTELENTCAIAMPRQLHEQDRSGARGAMPVALHRHEADPDQALS